MTCGGRREVYGAGFGAALYCNVTVLGEGRNVIRRTTPERFVRRTTTVVPARAGGPCYLPPPGVSFGGTPMTFTPDPRDTSIACTTRSYFTFGSPFTKMIFSGRPS